MNTYTFLKIKINSKQTGLYFFLYSVPSLHAVASLVALILTLHPIFMHNTAEVAFFFLRPRTDVSVM